MRQTLFSLLRPAYENTPELAGLASQARAEPECFDSLRRQIEFDDKVANELSTLKLADSQLNALSSLLSRPGIKAGPKTNEEKMTKLAETPAKSFPSPAEIRSKGAQNKEEIEEEAEEKREPARRAAPRTILFAVGVGLVATVCMAIFLIS